MIALWVATSYLIKNNRNRFTSLLTALPATFMSAVSVTYILVASEGFKLPYTIGYPVGITAAAVLFVIYIVLMSRKNSKVV